jgi:hypothetical protein
MSTLTRSLIDAAEGRRLDCLVAEYLFGWSGPVCWSDPVDEDDRPEPGLPASRVQREHRVGLVRRR